MSAKSTAVRVGTLPPRRLALVPPAFEAEPVTGLRAASLPLVLPEYGWVGSPSSFPPVMSGVRPAGSLSEAELATQPAPALVRRACATTMPPPSDGSLICVRR